MILNKEDDFQSIGLQIMDKCPYTASIGFQNGFENFLFEFYDHLLNCSLGMHVNEDQFELDLEIAFDLILTYVDWRANDLPVDQRKDFWLGVMTAAEITQKTFQFAFEVPVLDPAA